MSQKKELLWKIIINVEDYLLHAGWSRPATKGYTESKKQRINDNHTATSYSFLSSLPPSSLHDAELDDISSNKEACIAPINEGSDDWAKLIEDVKNLHFYSLPAYHPKPRLMMVFSYAENKLEKIRAYAQKWLDAIGISQHDVYFTTVYKTHHTVSEIVLTENEAIILEREVHLIQPQFLLVTGRLAYQALFKKRQSITKSRMYSHAYVGIPTIVTYDPELVLAYPILRQDVWRDLQRLKKLIEEKETSVIEVS